MYAVGSGESRVHVPVTAPFHLTQSDQCPAVFHKHSQPGVAPGTATIFSGRKQPVFSEENTVPLRDGSTPSFRPFRVANFDSEVPALNRREHGANPWRPTMPSCRSLPASLVAKSCRSVTG